MERTLATAFELGAAHERKRKGLVGRIESTTAWLTESKTRDGESLDNKSLRNEERRRRRTMQGFGRRADVA